MEYCEIKNPPVFTAQVEKWSKTTRDNGEEMAVPVAALFNNTVYNKAEIEKLKGKILKDIAVPVSGWSSLTYTITNAAITASSHVEVVYAFDSIPVVQKADIRGRTEAGKLVLVAKKLPAADIVVEEIHIVNR